MIRKLEDVLKEERLQQWLTIPEHRLTFGVVTRSGRWVWPSAENGEADYSSALYEIGSITKTFIGLLLAIGEERGIWSRSDPLSALVPELATSAFAKQTTLLQLVTHTANLPAIPRNLRRTIQDKLNPYAHYSESDLIEAVLSEKPMAKGRHMYSNYSFGLLGWILSKQLGMSLHEAMDELVFRPLGMKDAGFAGHLKDGMSLQPVFNAKGKPTPHWGFQQSMAGAGAICSTVSDMLTYAEANAGLSSSSISTALEECHKEHHSIFQSRGIGIGFGWMFYKEKDGSVTHWHNGGTYGSSSFAAFNREKGIGLVILSNRGVDLASQLPFIGRRKLNVDRFARVLTDKLFG